MEKLSYWLNEKNIIEKVSETWDANMDPETWADRASSVTVTGKPLLEFICDDVTRMYISSIIELVRLLPQSLFRHYRCDTPDTKRYMKMTVTPENNGWIRLTHELIKSEPLTRTVHFTPARQFLESKKTKQEYVRCSLCNQLSKGGNNIWYDADKFPELNLMPKSLPVSYGICPHCIKGNLKPNEQHAPLETSSG